MDGKIYTPFELGLLAFQARKGFNPFKEHSYEWNEWQMGWLWAKAHPIMDITSGTILGGFVVPKWH